MDGDGVQGFGMQGFGMLPALSCLQGYAVGGSRAGPSRLPLHRLPFVFPPPALVPKELPEQTVGNHGNHPLPPESRQEKGRKKARPLPFPHGITQNPKASPGFAEKKFGRD